MIFNINKRLIIRNLSESKSETRFDSTVLSREQSFIYFFDLEKKKERNKSMNRFFQARYKRLIIILNREIKKYLL